MKKERKKESYRKTAARKNIGCINKPLIVEPPFVFEYTSIAEKEV
ncbi:hypothetical protein ACSAZK_03940 [Methanosarcina sp. Mfa9]